MNSFEIDIDSENDVYCHRFSWPIIAYTIPFLTHLPNLLFDLQKKVERSTCLGPFGFGKEESQSKKSAKNCENYFLPGTISAELFCIPWSHIANCFRNGQLIPIE